MLAVAAVEEEQGRSLGALQSQVRIHQWRFRDQIGDRRVVDLLDSSIGILPE